MAAQSSGHGAHDFIIKRGSSAAPRRTLLRDAHSPYNDRRSRHAAAIRALEFPMKPFDTAGQPPVRQRSHPDQAEVADLATKLAALPHDAKALQERAAADSKPTATTRPGPNRHGWIWWICYVTAWAAVLTLALVAGLRIVYHDGAYFLTWLNAFTRYVYLPAYACLVWAAWQRRGLLGFASFVVVLCHLIWMAPDFVRDRRFDPPAGAAAQAAGTSPSIRIFFANVLQSNLEFDAMFAEIEAANPDLIVFAEWGWRWHKLFKQSPLAADYVHGASITQPHYGTVNLFSKLPLTSETLNYAAGRLVRTVDIQLGSQSLRLIGLHAARPLHPDQRDYESYWNQMLQILSSESRPLVVIGDFNATQHSLVYWRLKQMGLRSAHEDRGRGYATTWPNDFGGVSLIRIDQAFLSPEVECERIVEGRGKGSDHRPLLVDLRLR
jgi:endonuclease/exonuclease/phosphatase (EEP) superfamily protein YafD